MTAVHGPVHVGGFTTASGVNVTVARELTVKRLPSAGHETKIRYIATCEGCGPDPFRTGTVTSTSAAPDESAVAARTIEAARLHAVACTKGGPR